MMHREVTWRRLVPCLLVLAACLVVGCVRTSTSSSGGVTVGGGGNKGGETTLFTKDNFEKVKDGMSEKDIVAILGAPTETKDVGQGAEKTKQLTWKSGMSSASVDLDKEGKVAGKSSAFVNITIK